jgi:ribosomal protein L29
VSEQNRGLTLEELVRRLEALERENAELRCEVATLLCTNVVE